MTVRELVAKDLDAVVRAVGDEVRELEGRSVLLSGGAGFIGCHLVAVFQKLNREVLKKPCELTILDNYITGTVENPLVPVDDPHIRYVEHDVTVPYKRPGPVDYILHAAGIASPVYYRTYPIEAIESAIAGAKNLLDLAKEKRVRGFLFFSSSEIYGDPDAAHIPTPETYRGNVSCTGPRACYDESKRLGETLCMTYHQRFGVPSRSVRPFNVYGPGMKPDDSRVIPTFFMRALEGKPLPVHVGGKQTRTFCYVTDALAGFFKVLLAGRSGEAYNVGNPRGEISVMELAREVASLFEGKVKVESIEYPESYPHEEPQRRVPDISKLKAEVGFEPSVELREGLTRTLAWYREIAAARRHDG